MWTVNDIVGTVDWIREIIKCIVGIVDATSSIYQHITYKLEVAKKSCFIVIHPRCMIYVISTLHADPALSIISHGTRPASIINAGRELGCMA